MKGPRMLLVEDDRALADLLVWHFERQGFEIERTGDGEQALLLAEEEPPDVVILDWMIEGVSGIEVCRRLRRRPATANVPIIMVTARGEESERIRGIETGADDYITKPFSPRELVARVNAVIRRARPAIAASQLTYADLEMDLIRHRVTRGGHKVSLGPTEYRLLRYLLLNRDRVLSKRQLLDHVWDDAAAGELSAVETYISYLRRKLDDRDTRLIRTVRGVGYALREPEPSLVGEKP